MTYVQYINCSKWKKVIGISLWIGSCIGLGYAINLSLPIWGSDSVYWNICNEAFDFKTGGFYADCHPDWVKEGSLIGLVVVLNAINYFMIWRTMNNHYQWLEIRCGVKPNPNEVKHE